jgi:hypothetical protein
MLSIDLIIRSTAMPMSVEKKEPEEAEATYQKILEAMRGATPVILELTCDKQPDKKIAVCSDQISGVMVSQKSGSANSGKVAGFFATTVNE